jgi:D-arabinose 1-dehydrogenase-like Zn-dependent alcohol dehydrogenase
MQAAVLEVFEKPLVIHPNWPDPQCGGEDAIVRVEAEGSCRSDWHARMGDWEWIGFKPALPRVIRYEFCGVVEEVGAQVARFKKGDRVVVPFNHGCGTCEYCQAGHQNVCANLQVVGFHYDGGYGQYARVPRADLNLVPLPETITFVEAASLGCRFMTSFHGVVDQARVQAGEWVAVHGCGGIGLAAVHIAAALGANVIAIDINDTKLMMATELGATCTVDASRVGAPAAVADLTAGGAHVSVDALGKTVTCRNSLLSLRKRGRHLQIGLTTRKEKGEVLLPIDRFVALELHVVGTIGMQPPRYPRMLRMVETGKLTPGKLVCQTIAVEQASDVLTAMTQYNTLGVTVSTQW